MSLRDDILTNLARADALCALGFEDDIVSPADIAHALEGM